jgi:hypothetical protein
MLRSKETITEIHNDLGQTCVENCYQAYEKEDIINFIENTIIKGDDPKKKGRDEFVNKELKVNYPNASKVILQYIKEELGIINTK